MYTEKGKIMFYVERREREPKFDEETSNENTLNGSQMEYFIRDLRRRPNKAVPI